MKTALWIIVLIAGISLGGVSVWLALGPEQAAQPQQQPRLTPIRPGGDSAAPPAQEVTTDWLEDTTEANEIKEENDTFPEDEDTVDIKTKNDSSIVLDNNQQTIREEKV